MPLVIVIDLIVVLALIGITASKGLERALPFFIFVAVLLPEESIIPLPGLTLPTRRLGSALLILLFVIFPPPKSAVPGGQPVPLKVVIGLQLLCTAISAALSVVPVISLKQMLAALLEYYLLFFILTRTITTMETVHRIMKAMAYAVIVACAFGAYEAYTGISVVFLFPSLAHRFGTPGEVLDTARGIRVISTFGNPELFGAGIAFVTVEILYLLSVERKTAQKVILWIGLLLAFLNIFKTGSRGPWMALAMGLGLQFILGKSSTRRTLVFLAGLTTLVLIVRPGIREQLYNMYAGTVTTDPDSPLASSYQYRFALIKVGERALAKQVVRQVFGFGLESFYYLDLTGPFLDDPEHHFLSGDNAYVVVMVEAGYLGLLVFIALLIKVLLGALKTFIKVGRQDDGLALVLLINIIQYYFMMTNVGLYGWGQTGLMLWTWISFTAIYRNLIGVAPASGAVVTALSDEWMLASSGMDWPEVVRQPGALAPTWQESNCGSAY